MSNCWIHGRNGVLGGILMTQIALTRASHQCTIWWGAFYDADKSALWYLFNRGAPATGAPRLNRYQSADLSAS